MGERPLAYPASPVDSGYAEMIEVVSSNVSFDTERLVQEVSLARSVLEFSDGPYGNCISLPSEKDVGVPFRTHHNNVPFSGALQECQYLRHIFDSFLTDKAAFRLLRRGPISAYALHDDKDKGTGIARFQIPIHTNKNAFVLLPHESMNLEFVHAAATRSESEGAGDIWFDLEGLDRVSGGQFELFSLKPGILYHFDTDQLHTVINAGNHERIVLSLDLVMNDWLRDWMRSHLVQRVSPSTVRRESSIRWKWNSLRCGIIRTA